MLGVDTRDMSKAEMGDEDVKTPGSHQNIEALRFDMGRKHNFDFMLVAMPMAFKMILNRENDLATTTLEFPTVHGNGMFGTMTPAPMLRGMLKEEKHFNTAVRYVKKFLPAAHPLVVKGWKRLPAGAHSLSRSRPSPSASGQTTILRTRMRVDDTRSAGSSAGCSSHSARACVYACVCVGGERGTNKQ